MDLSKMSDGELMLLARGPVDNLARQKSRSVGVDRYDVKNLPDEDLYAAAGVPMETARPATKLPVDQITSDELYAGGSSPESLKAELDRRDQQRPAKPHEPSVKDRLLKALSSPRDWANSQLEGLNTVGALASRAADSATAGVYSRGRNFLFDKLGVGDDAARADQQTAQEHPFLSNAASAAGYLSPVGVPSMAAKAAGAAGGMALRALPEAMATSRLIRPVVGAAEGALTAAPIAAAETGVAGGSPDEMLSEAGRGAKFGAVLGAGLGVGSAAVDKASEMASGQLDKRRLAITEGATPTRRDRVVGRGGEKADRVLTDIRRYPELDKAAIEGDPRAALRATDDALDQLDAKLDAVYAPGGVPRAEAVPEHVPPETSGMSGATQRLQSPNWRPIPEVPAEHVTTLPEPEGSRAIPPVVRARAKAFEQSQQAVPEEVPPETTMGAGATARLETPNWPTDPNAPARVDPSALEIKLTDLAQKVAQQKVSGARELAAEIMSKADEVHSWGTAPVDAKEVRGYATSLGKTLFKGNPNADRTLANAIRTQVYNAVTGEITNAVEEVRPGSTEELQSLNAEKSDLLNLRAAIESRLGTEHRASNRLVNRAHEVLDWGMAFTNPGHFAAKKAVQYAAPKAMRAGERFLANSGTPGSAVLQETNPLLRALDAAREQDRRRAAQLQFQKLNEDADKEAQLQELLARLMPQQPPQEENRQ